MTIDPSTVGGAADASAIRITAVTERDQVPSIPRTALEAPLDVVLEIVRDWLDHDTGGTNPLVLAFSSSPREQLGAVPGIEHRAFAPDALGLFGRGKVFVCTESLGRAVEYEHLVGSASEAATHLEQLRLHRLPTLVVSGQGAQAFWYPSGIGEADNYLRFNLQAEDGYTVSLESVDSMLAQHYELHLKTPYAGGRVWMSPPAAHVPVANTETHIQHGIWIAAKATFGRSHRVRIEDVSASGRTDILITALPSVPRARGAALLELKVLRAKHYSAVVANALPYSQAENVEGIRKGIGQAHSYGVEQGCDLRLLCLFDMRMEDDAAILDAFIADMERLGIHWRRYYLYTSSDDARAATMRVIGMDHGEADSNHCDNEQP